MGSGEIIAMVAIPGVITCILIGAWILWPLDTVAAHRRRPVQFTVIDFLGLVFLLQLPMALINLGTGMHAGMRGDQLAMYVLAWIGTALVWWRSIVVFSRAGVTQAKDRALTVFLVLPMAYLGTFAVPILLVAATLGNDSTLMRIVMLTIAAAVTFGVVSAGIVSRRIAHRSEFRQEELTPKGTHDDPIPAELVEPDESGHD
jgi:hypothetical protein